MLAARTSYALVTSLLLSISVCAQTPEVRPIFEKSCYGCHGPKLQSADLRLDAGRPSKVIVPGKSAETAVSFCVRIRPGWPPA